MTITTRMKRAAASFPGAFTALALGATTVDAQRPTLPRVRSEPCAGYCNPVWASCARIELRATPSANAPVSAVVDSGVKVDVVAGERHTTAFGVVVVRRAFTQTQRFMTPDGDTIKPNPRRWRFERGDTLFLVDRESDGDSFENFVFVFRGREDTTAAFWHDPLDPPRGASVELVAPLRQQWWARVRGPRGQTGWTTHGQMWTGTSHYDDPLEKCVAARSPLPASRFPRYTPSRNAFTISSAKRSTSSTMV